MEAEAVAQLRAVYTSRLPLLEAVCNELERLAIVGLGGYEPNITHIDRIGFRVKGVDSFVEKVVDRGAKPAYTNPLSQVEDQIGGRVIVLFQHDLAPVEELLLETFRKVELEHRVPEKDAEFGYESTHLVCLIPPQARLPGWPDEPSMPNTFELQVRTLFMHAYAEPNHNLGYKSPTQLTREQKRKLGWIAASAWGADQALEDAWVEIGQAADSGAGRG